LNDPSRVNLGILNKLLTLDAGWGLSKLSRQVLFKYLRVLDIVVALPAVTIVVGAADSHCTSLTGEYKNP